MTTMTTDIMTEDEKRALRREHLGTRLRDLRVAMKLTQWDVARGLGYTSAQFVSNFERGVAYPPTDKLPALAKLFGVKARDIVKAICACRVAEVEAWERAALAQVRRSA